MAKNSKNIKNQNAKPAQKTGGSGRKVSPVIIVVSVLLIIALLAVIITGVVHVINSGSSIDYMHDDLSKYVTIDAADYKNYPVGIPLLSLPDDKDVEREVNKLLVANKDETPSYNGAAIHSPEYVLKIGDVVNLWYSGYVIEDGVRKELDRASNYASDTPHKLELGAGEFISDLEDAIIGMKLQPNDLVKVTDGKVMAGDVIYLSYQSYNADGSVTSFTSRRIDLGADYIDKLYGTGFRDYLIGKDIGVQIPDTKIFRIEGEEADTAYYKMTVDFVTRCEDKAVKIPVVFPADYSEASLRGKSVTFEIFAYNAVLYNTPAWDDTFITGTLEVSADELSSFEGATLTEKYEAKILSELKANTESANRSLIEEAMWAHFKKKANIKKLPEDEVSLVYRQYYDEVQSQFAMYSSYYKTVDEFAIAYFGLETNSDWRSYITARAEAVISEKLIFYYILQKEALVPDDAEFKRRYEEMVEEYFEYHKSMSEAELAACKTDAEREAKLKEIREQMMNYYGVEYFEENTYYQYALEILVSWANTEAAIA